MKESLPDRKVIVVRYQIRLFKDSGLLEHVDRKKPSQVLENIRTDVEAGRAERLRLCLDSKIDNANSIQESLELSLDPKTYRKGLNIGKLRLTQIGNNLSEEPDYSLVYRHSLDPQLNHVTHLLEENPLDKLPEAYELADNKMNEFEPVEVYTQINQDGYSANKDDIKQIDDIVASLEDALDSYEEFYSSSVTPDMIFNIADETIQRLKDAETVNYSETEEASEKMSLEEKSLLLEGEKSYSETGLKDIKDDALKLQAESVTNICKAVYLEDTLTGARNELDHLI